MIVSGIGDYFVVIQYFFNSDRKDIPTCRITVRSIVLLDINSGNAVLSDFNDAFITFYFSNKHFYPLS